jgi:hypothetical protein
MKHVLEIHKKMDILVTWLWRAYDSLVKRKLVSIESLPVPQAERLLIQGCTLNETNYVT